MNKFLINLVGHEDLHAAKKQMIKEIFAFTEFPKSRTSKEFLWNKDIQELALLHRELLNYRGITQCI